MNNLILGILIGAALVIFCLFCMEKSIDITDEEADAWRDWLERKKGRRSRVIPPPTFDPPPPPPPQPLGWDRRGKRYREQRGREDEEKGKGQ